MPFRMHAHPRPLQPHSQLKQAGSLDSVFKHPKNNNIRIQHTRVLGSKFCGNQPQQCHISCFIRKQCFRNLGHIQMAKLDDI